MVPFGVLVISRVIIRITPLRALITLLITYLLSPLPLPVMAGGALFTTASLVCCCLFLKNSRAVIGNTLIGVLPVDDLNPGVPLKGAIRAPFRGSFQGSM